MNSLNRTYNTTPKQWKQIQKIELPPGFFWKQGDILWGIHTVQPFWWHWFYYTLETSQTHPQKSVWYHDPSKGPQNKVATIPDPVDAAHYMAAKIYLGMYE